MAFGHSYMELYYELNKCHWNRLVLQNPRDCDPIERQLHILAKQLNMEKGSHSRNASRVINYALVDYHPDVIALRKFLATQSNYIVEDQIDTDKMTTDFLLLMALRDRHAKKSGFESYATMVLSLEGLEPEHLRDVLEERLNSELDQAKGLIDKYSIKLDKWYTGLREVKCGAKVNHIMLLDKFMNYFPSAKENISIERNMTNRTGFAAELSHREVRVNVERVDTLFDMFVFFHQMGHGLAHALDATEGIDRIYSNFYEELTGVIIERYLGRMLGEEIAQCLDEVRCLQYARFAIEALFELDLWFSDTSPEDLFRAHYQKIIGSLDDAPINVLNTIKLSEPLYMYNYILADIVAEKIIEAGPEDLTELADYLVTEVFTYGENKNWVELL